MRELPTLGARGEGWVVLQGVILVAVLGAGIALGGAWGDPIRGPLALVGLGLGLAGGMLAFRGLVDLGRSLTPLPHPRDDATLIRHGAYRLARHPIYGGLILGAAGWALLTASAVALVGALVLLAFFDLKSRREEAWLVARFPDYAAYRAGTRRLIPWVY